jgi:hypothetical protein
MNDAKQEDTKPDPQPAANAEAKSEEKAAAGPGLSTNSGTDAKPGQSDAKPEQGSNKSAGHRSAPGSAPAPEGLPKEKKAEQQPESKSEPKLDPEIKALVTTQVKAQVDARLEAALESKIDPLLEVNRKLAHLLGEQIEITIKLRQSVAAMERLMEADTRRKSKYAEMLEKVKSEGDGMADPHWINRTRGMLGQLQRTGTTGPKIEGEANQS